MTTINIRKNKLLILVLLTALILFFGAVMPAVRSKDPSNPPFAFVNGKPLYLNELKKALKDAGSFRVNLPFTDLCDAVVRDMIDTELIFQAAEKNSNLESPDRAALIKNALKEKVYDRINVSDEEARNYYLKNNQALAGRDFQAYSAIIKKEIGYKKSKVLYNELVTQLRRNAEVDVRKVVIQSELGCR